MPAFVDILAAALTKARELDVHCYDYLQQVAERDLVQSGYLAPPDAATSDFEPDLQPFQDETKLQFARRRRIYLRYLGREREAAVNDPDYLPDLRGSAIRAASKTKATNLGLKQHQYRTRLTIRDLVASGHLPADCPEDAIQSRRIFTSHERENFEATRLDICHNTLVSRRRWAPYRDPGPAQMFFADPAWILDRGELLRMEEETDEEYERRSRVLNALNDPFYEAAKDPANLTYTPDGGVFVTVPRENFVIPKETKSVIIAMIKNPNPA